MMEKVKEAKKEALPVPVEVKKEEVKVEEVEEKLPEAIVKREKIPELPHVTLPEKRPEIPTLSDIPKPPVREAFRLPGVEKSLKTEEKPQASDMQMAMMKQEQGLAGPPGSEFELPGVEESLKKGEKPQAPDMQMAMMGQGAEAPPPKPDEALRPGAGLKLPEMPTKAQTPDMGQMPPAGGQEQTQAPGAGVPEAEGKPQMQGLEEMMAQMQAPGGGGAPSGEMQMPGEGTPEDVTIVDERAPPEAGLTEVGPKPVEEQKKEFRGTKPPLREELEKEPDIPRKLSEVIPDVPTKVEPGQEVEVVPEKAEEKEEAKEEVAAAGEEKGPIEEPAATTTWFKIFLISFVLLLVVAVLMTGRK